MSRFDPSRPDALQHGGTFNNDVLTMAAGAAGLTCVLTEAETALVDQMASLTRAKRTDVIKSALAVIARVPPRMSFFMVALLLRLALQRIHQDLLLVSGHRIYRKQFTLTITKAFV